MDFITTIDELREHIESQADVLPLVTNKLEIIPGEGPQTAEIVFIGEAPGYHETVARRPFVGRSGQLFRSALRDAGFAETDVFITNIVKARPPENRDPLPAEIVAYKPFLDKEIELISPKLIVTLGRLSMAKFLPDVKISQVHGRLHKVKWNEATQFVLPMYHPAAALRATQVKNSFLSDFGKIDKIVQWVREQNSSTTLTDAVTEYLF